MNQFVTHVVNVIIKQQQKTLLRNMQSLSIKYSLCEYKATDKGHLKRHVKSIHEGIHYPCSQCDYKAPNKSDFKKHVDNKHNDICYSCDQCSCKGTVKGNLNQHVQYEHEGVVLEQM